MTAREHEGTFWSDGNVLHLDCGGGYTDVYICQNSLKRILQMQAFYCTYVYLYSKELDLTPKEVWPLSPVLGGNHQALGMSLFTWGLGLCW